MRLRRLEVDRCFTWHLVGEHVSRESRSYARTRDCVHGSRRAQQPLAARTRLRRAQRQLRRAAPEAYLSPSSCATRARRKAMWPKDALSSRVEMAATGSRTLRDPATRMGAESLPNVTGCCGACLRRHADWTPRSARRARSVRWGPRGGLRRRHSGTLVTKPHRGLPMRVPKRMHISPVSTSLAK